MMNCCKDSNIRIVYISGIMLIVLSIMAEIYTFSKYNGDSFHGIGNNIIFYFLSCFIGLLIAVFFFILSPTKLEKNHTVGRIIIAVATILLIVGCIQFYFAENEWQNDVIILTRHHISFVLFGLFFAFVLVLFVKNITFSFSVYGRIMVVSFIAIMGALYCYGINPFSSSMALAHEEGYVESIYCVMSGEPYGPLNSTIYGHYALLFLPFRILRFFGFNNHQIIALVLMIEGMIGFGIFAVLGMRLIENDKIFALYEFSLLCYIVMPFQGMPMFQEVPHRLFFPAMCIAVFLKFREKRIWFYYALCLLAIVYNLETGLVCLAAFLFYRFMKNIHDRKVVQLILELLIAPILSIIGAYLLTGFINLLLGGNFFDFKDFLYPLGGNIDTLWPVIVRPFLKGIPPQIPIIVISVSAIVIYIEGSVRKKNMTTQTMITAYLALMTLGIGIVTCVRVDIQIFVYLMPILLLLISLVIEQMRSVQQYDENSIVKQGTKIAQAAMVLFLTFSSIESMMYFRDDFQARAFGQWNNETLEFVKERVRAGVPKDTCAYGDGINAIYSELGWENDITVAGGHDRIEVLDYVSEKMNDDSIDFFLLAENGLTEGIDLPDHKKVVRNILEIAGTNYNLYSDCTEDEMWMYKIYSDVFDTKLSVKELDRKIEELRTNPQELANEIYEKISYYNDYDYVKSCYEIILQRICSTEELMAWKNQLEMGMDRKELLMCFIQSDELHSKLWT